MNKKENTYTYDQVAAVLIIIGLVSLWLATIWNMEKRIEGLQKDLETQEQHYECFLDSLNDQIDLLETTFDSIPIGSPLDTIVLQDDYGVRKHPIFGSYQMHSGVDMIDTWHDTVYATASGIVRFASWNYGMVDV